MCKFALFQKVTEVHKSVFPENQTASEINYIKAYRIFFTIFIDLMTNVIVFMDVYCRNMYDELTSTKNANQYEDILKRGRAN